MEKVALITVICFLHYVQSKNECIKLDVTVTQKVENEGFHRNIQWLLELQNPKYESWLLTKCNMTLMVDVNAGMFVNPDEIANLNRLNKMAVRVEGEVNVETPAYESTSHVAYVHVPVNNSNKIPLELPIHLRYQRAQIIGGFGKVHLKKPYLLVSCPEDSRPVCGNEKLVEAPCEVLGSDQCSWTNVTYQALFEEVEMFVPIGDLDDYPLVSIVTLLLGCAGCIYILSILSTAPL